MTDLLLVFTTFASEADAVRVLRMLVDERLIACGNVVPGMRSIYRWKGDIADEREVLCVLKTRKQDWTALLSRIHELHSYETPEVIAVRMASVAPRYQAWLEDSLAPEGAS
jgi:periplasmic divalent cation tolerance protein